MKDKFNNMDFDDLDIMDLDEEDAVYADIDLDMPEEDGGFDLEADVMGSSDDSEDDLFSDESSEEQAGAEQILPSPADLGVDMTVNN